MTEESCPCCGTVTDQRTSIGSSTEHWEIDDSALMTQLPEDLGSALGQFLGTHLIDTLGGWVAAVRYYTDGDAISIDDLCLTEDQTDHWGVVAGETYHFVCFYDAVILAALVEKPVQIRTKSPNGTVIKARAVGTDELTVNPGDAVFSFGIAHDISSPLGNPPSLARGYAAICPYVNAFPNRDAYTRWAASVPASTIAMPLAGATDLAAALVQ